MLKFLSTTALAGLVAASQDEPQVNVTCSGESDLIIDIGYDRSVDLLKLVGGTCNETTVDYSQNNVTNAVQIKMDMRDCGLRSAGRLMDEAIAFESVVDVSLGRSDSGMDMVFYNNKVNLTCTVQSDYEVSLSYGEIDADYSGDEAMAGGEKAYTFGIRSTDSDFNETVAPSNRAGDKVYLDVYSDDVDFNQYKFGLKSCTFKEMDGANVVTEYNLFNNTENSCKNNFLDFSINYCNDTNSFKITHTVFTFDPSRQNNYTLSCAIKLCDFEVTASNAQCEEIENNCGIDTIMPKEASTGDDLISAPTNCTNMESYDTMTWEFKSTMSPSSFTTNPGCNGWFESWRDQTTMYADGLGKICATKTLKDVNSVTESEMYYRVNDVFIDSTVLASTDSRLDLPFHEVCPDLCASAFEVNPTGCVASPKPLDRCKNHDGMWFMEFSILYNKAIITKSAMGCSSMREKFLEVISLADVDSTLKSLCQSPNTMGNMDGWLGTMGVSTTSIKLNAVALSSGDADLDLRYNQVCQDFCSWKYDVQKDCIKN